MLANLPTTAPVDEMDYEFGYAAYAAGESLDERSTSWLQGYRDAVAKPIVKASAAVTERWLSQ